MTSVEEQRLAALGRTLVRAAAEQAGRRRRRRRRTVVLAAVAAPLVLAAAGSMAAAGYLTSVDDHLSTLRDERLEVPAGAVAPMASAAGARPRSGMSGRSWLVAGRRVIGYETPGGLFCFRFVGYTGGCIAKGALSPDQPLDAMVDNGPGQFRVYGLAADGVVAVSVRVHGVTRRAAVARNAFFLAAPAFGNRRGFVATLIVRSRHGTTRTLPLRVGGFASSTIKRLPELPGSRPGANTAA